MRQQQWPQLIKLTDASTVSGFGDRLEQQRIFRNSLHHQQQTLRNAEAVRHVVLAAFLPNVHVAQSLLHVC